MPAICPCTTRNELDLNLALSNSLSSRAYLASTPSKSVSLPLLLSNLDTLPQALHLELLTRAPAVNVLDVIGCGFEVARGIVALGDVDLVLGPIVQGLIQGDGSSQELLLDLSEALQTGLELQMVVCRCLSDGGDDGNPVTLGADVVCGRNAGNVDVLFESVSTADFEAFEGDLPFFRPT